MESVCIVQSTARTPARRQNGPRSGTHLGTSAATPAQPRQKSPKASIVRGSLVSILSFGIDKKILRDLLSCGWRRLTFRTAGKDIPVPPLKNQKTTELLRRTAMKFRPLHDRVVIKRIEAEEKTSGGIIIPDTAKEKTSGRRGHCRRPGWSR